MMRPAGLARQSLFAWAPGARRCPARAPAVGPPRCSIDGPPPKPKSTRGRKKAAAPTDQVAAAVGGADESTLLKLSKAELQALAEAKGIPKSGTKAQIAARILGAEGGAAAESAPAPAAAAAPAKKPRAPRTKVAAKKDEKEFEAKTKAPEDPARRLAVLEGQAAAVAVAVAVVSALNCTSRVLRGQQEALGAAIQVSAARSTKRRVLEGQQRAMAAAAAAVAAVNARLRVLGRQQRAIFAAQTAATAANANHRAQEGQQEDVAAPAAPAVAGAEPGLPPPGSRRRLSPAEATRVLEEIARRKGAVAAVAGPTSTKVEHARRVMAELRADLEAQERRTQQLQAVIERGAASAQLAARRSAAGGAAGGGAHEPSGGAAAAGGGSSGPGKVAPSSSPAVEFLGAALVAVGRALSLALSSGTKPRH